MTHSHKRTTLAKMGFEDQDAGDTQHELACKFVADPAVAIDVARHALPNPKLWETESRESAERTARARAKDGTGRDFYVSEIGADTALEHMVVKGDGKYAATVGFVDCLISVGPRTRTVSVTSDGDVTLSGPSKIHEYSARVIAEVKIARVTVTELLKQLRLYERFVREERCGYLRCETAAVCLTAFDFTSADRVLLRENGVRTVRLGERFERWKAMRLSASTDEPVATL